MHQRLRLLNRGRLVGLTAALLVLGAPARAEGVLESMLCVSRAIYWEARDQSELAQRGVGHVVKNLAAFRGVSACDVVNSPRWNGPEFRKLLIYGKIKERAPWETAQRIALQVLGTLDRDLTWGAVAFHDTSVSPTWNDRAFTVRLDKLLFYKPRNGWSEQ